MTLTLPVYSGLTAGLLLIMQLVLMLTVGMVRLKTGQGIGDGQNPALALLVRRHGNLAENAAIFLVALMLLEILGGNATVVGGLGGAFVVARVAHAVGLSLGDGPNVPRFIGAMGTAFTGFAAAGFLLARTAGSLPFLH